MKKLTKDKSREKNGSIISNRIVMAALAGAVAGLVVTYLLDSERGRVVLGKVGESVKGFANNLKLPALLRT